MSTCLALRAEGTTRGNAHQLRVEIDVTGTATNGPGTGVAVDNSNIDQDLADGVGTITDGSNTIELGEAVDVINVSGNDNIVAEEGGGFLRTTFTGTGNLIEVSNDQHVIAAPSHLRHPDRGGRGQEGLQLIWSRPNGNRD
jgi:hypothetical protein